MTPAAWYPAHHCGHAEHTLRWGHLHGGAHGWKLRHRGAVIAALVGYPDGAPANTQVQAIAWADSLLGPQQWIQKPPRSGAHHTHSATGQTCTSPPDRPCRVAPARPRRRIRTRPVLAQGMDRHRRRNRGRQPLTRRKQPWASSAA